MHARTLIIQSRNKEPYPDKIIPRHEVKFVYEFGVGKLKLSILVTVFHPRELKNHKSQVSVRLYWARSLFWDIR